MELPRLVRKTIRLTGRKWPTYLVAGAMTRSATDCPSFLVLRLTPEYIGFIVRRSILSSRMQALDRTVALDVAEFVDGYKYVYSVKDDGRVVNAFGSEFKYFEGDLEGIEAYKALARIDDREIAYDFYDEDPELWEPANSDDAELMEDGEWRVFDCEERVRLRCCGNTTALNWEVFLEGGRLVSSVDVAVKDLWDLLGSKQGFYFPNKLFGAEFFPCVP